MLVSVTKSSLYSVCSTLFYAYEAGYNEPNDEESDPKPEAEVDEPEPGLEVELVSPQEEISSRPTAVEELPIETLVDPPTDPTMALVPPLTVMRASLSLRSPDVYDPLQTFLQDA